MLVSDMSEVYSKLEANTILFAQTLAKMEAFYKQSSVPAEERPPFLVQEQTQEISDEVFLRD